MTNKFDLWSLLKTKDFDQVKKFVETNPEILKQKIPFAGGNWLHFTAAHSSLRIFKYLIGQGFDINAEGELDGDRAICNASCYDKPDIVTYLLDNGAILDTDKLVRNPLFSAIIGKSFESAKLLLDSGIDATIRYDSDTMNEMDAIAFALLHSQPDIANLIAQHLSNGDKEREIFLMEQAAKISGYNGPLQQVRILPDDTGMLELGRSGH